MAPTMVNGTFNDGAVACPDLTLEGRREPLRNLPGSDLRKAVVSLTELWNLWIRRVRLPMRSLKVIEREGDVVVVYVT